MPNWCDNQTEIVFKSEVKQEEISNFINKFFTRNKEQEKIINLMELVPLQENGQWDYDLANQKWGSKWSPTVDYMNYDEKDRILNLDYLSAWSPINEAFKTIYENHSNIIESISTNYEENGMMFYGDFYVDKNGIEDNTYDLPSINIEEDEFKQLYDLIKYKNADIELPEQIIEDIQNSEDYNDFIKSMPLHKEIDLDDYDFDELWENYIYDSDIHFDLRNQMKQYSQDFDKYVNNAIIYHTHLKNKKSL